MLLTVASKVRCRIIYFAVAKVLIVCHLLRSLKVIYYDSFQCWADEKSQNFPILIRDGRRQEVQPGSLHNPWQELQGSYNGVSWWPWWEGPRIPQMQGTYQCHQYHENAQKHHSGEM